MLTNILDSLDNKYGYKLNSTRNQHGKLTCSFNLMDWLDDNDFPQYDKYDRAYNKIDKLGIETIWNYNSPGEWVIPNGEYYQYPIEELSTKKLYVIVKSLLTLPTVLTAINAELFKSINEF